VIRTSVDREDMSIIILPMPRGKQNAFEEMFFIVARGKDDAGACPGKIPKTIIFIDGRLKLGQVASILQGLLINATKDCSGLRYSTNPNDEELCVHNVVEFVAAWVNPYDMKKRYDEFTKPLSKHRVMIATTVLGMGVNIEDVEVIVCWGLPIYYVA
jgi:hypothetical protein